MHEKHGFNAKDRLYRIWVAMRQRCEKPYRTNYAEYGGRGIAVCESWRTSFPAFRAWALGNGYSDSRSIDRIDTDGNYEPGNCRWATPQEQATNQRCACKIEAEGVTLTVAEWAARKNMHLTTLYRRYRRGVRGEALFSGVAPKGSKSGAPAN